MTDTIVQDVFLLSPAYCGGRRASLLLRPGSSLPLALRLRDGTLPLGEAFTFMSGLYFRGKLAYAQRFAPPAGRVLVITPTRGLQPPSVAVSDAVIREFASVDVLTDDARYHVPLRRDLEQLIAEMATGSRVVLLGSIATGKYVDVLRAMLGPRLHFPKEFVGRGDMSRGGLLLRAAADGQPLDYVAFTDEVVRHGARPPKLAPLRRAAE